MPDSQLGDQPGEVDPAERDPGLSEPVDATEAGGDQTEANPREPEQTGVELRNLERRDIAEVDRQIKAETVVLAEVNGEIAGTRTQIRTGLDKRIKLGDLGADHNNEDLKQVNKALGYLDGRLRNQLEKRANQEALLDDLNRRRVELEKLSFDTTPVTFPGDFDSARFSDGWMGGNDR